MAETVKRVVLVIVVAVTSLWLAVKDVPAKLSELLPPTPSPIIVSYNSDRTLKAVNGHREVTITNVQTGREWLLERVPESVEFASVRWFVFSADNHWLAAAGCPTGTYGTFCPGYHVLVWDVNSGELALDADVTPLRVVGRLRFLDHQRLEVVGCPTTDDYSCDTQMTMTLTLPEGELLDVATFVPVVTPTQDLPLNLAFEAVAFSRDERFKVGVYRTIPYGWDLWTGELFVLDPMPDSIDWERSVNTLVFSSDNRLLAASGCGEQIWHHACEKGRIMVWDVTARTLLHVIDSAPLLYVTTLVFGEDGTTLIASGCVQYPDPLFTACKASDMAEARWDAVSGSAK